MALLQTAFPNTRIDAEPTVNLWYSLYKEVDFDVAKKATELIIRTETFFPTHQAFGKALFACQEKSELSSRLPAYSEETVNQKLNLISEWWENGEMD